MKLNKILSMVVATGLCLGALTGCGTAEAAKSQTTKTEESKTISIVTTIFPEYDWVRQIVGDNDNVEITLLLDNGVDLHNYQPTADDIMKVSQCDVFVYVGGESDEWVNDALDEAVNPNMQVVDLLDALGDTVKEEEVVEGMQGEEEEEDEEGEEEEVEYDEHVWLSLKNAQVLVDAIEKAIETVDADNAATYQANAEAYKEQLAELDGKYEAMVSSASQKTVLFGDRFPFRYLVDDYGLQYYAAFVGCSAETEASFKTITFLSKKVDELGLKNVFTIENSDQKIAKTIIENTSAKDANILTLDSLQSTTSEQIASGATYLGAMEDNLKVLEQGLN